MAYKKKELTQMALEAIESGKLIFFDELPAALPVSLRTLYNKRLHEVQDIKEALANNKIAVKQGLRKKWYKSEHPATQIALYKLVAADEELERLQPRKSQVEVTGPNEQPLIPDPVARMIERAYADETANTDTDGDPSENAD